MWWKKPGRSSRVSRALGLCIAQGFTATHISPSPEALARPLAAGRASKSDGHHGHASERAKIARAASFEARARRRQPRCTSYDARTPQDDGDRKTRAALGGSIVTIDSHFRRFHGEPTP